jgi:HEAT repeat protein
MRVIGTPLCVFGIAALLLAPSCTTRQKNQAGEPSVPEQVESLLVDVARGGEGRKQARARLIALGPAATETLLAHMRSPERDVRWEIANVLVYTRDPNALDALVEAVLQDPSSHVRWRCLRALREIDAPSTAQRFSQLLDSEDQAARWRAAVAASTFELREALPVLQQGVDAPDPYQAWEAVDALSRLPDPSSVAPLRRVLEGTRQRLRHEAILTLGSIPHPSSRDTLIAYLADDMPGVRWRSAKMLARFPNDTALRALQQRLQVEPDSTVRSKLEEALTTLGDRTSW